MKKASLLLIYCSVAATLASAQTKRIFHKSHSGHQATFMTAISKNGFGAEYSNFGNPKIDGLKYSSKYGNKQAIRIDSIIRKSDTTIIIVKKSVPSWDLLGQKTARQNFSNPAFAKLVNPDSLLKFITDTYAYAILTPKDSIHFVNIARLKAHPAKGKKK